MCKHFLAIVLFFIKELTKIFSLLITFNCKGLFLGDVILIFYTTYLSFLLVLVDDIYRLSLYLFLL